VAIPICYDRHLGRRPHSDWQDAGTFLARKQFECPCRLDGSLAGVALLSRIEQMPLVSIGSRSQFLEAFRAGVTFVRMNIY
jgi:hypothetical protein